MTDNLICASGGTHKSLEAKERCWGCSHPERLAFNDEDTLMAQQLIDEGYKSTSNKYRTVAKVSLPSFEECVTIDESTPPGHRKALKDAWDRASNYLLRVHGSNDGVIEKELTVGQFRAFKVLGGDMA